MQKKEVKKDVDEGKYIKWFSELGKEDTAIVGGKGANLGEMYNLKLPVPPGFCITTKGYLHFLQETGLDKEIYNMLSKINTEDTKQLDETALKIREMIEKAEMPKEVEEEILENYEALNVDRDILEHATGDALTILKRGYEPLFVAVRSSATAEDTGTASFAGQQETFVNIKGNTNVIEAVKRCWASLFTARSVYYRIKKGFKHENILISVIIQIMVNSEKSGVIFSHDPVEAEENVVIEAVFGLGEGIVSGKIQPDHYLVSRDLKILSKGIADKKIAITRDSSGSTITVNLTAEKSKQQVLTDYEIKKLADYALRLEEHYKIPQDIEFAIDSGKLFIVQTRPITTLSLKKQKQELKGEEILKGLAASPGIGSGTVKIVRNLDDLEKIKKNDVLVTRMTNPDMVVAMQKAAAIVTDEGGVTSHAAIVSREMGIPCVVGTDKATKILKEGMEVTVNGFDGKIYLGKQEEIKAEIKQVLDTKTKIKIIVDLPDYAARASKTGIKAVGLVRIEGIIAESGKHPFFFLKEKKLDEYERVLSNGLGKIAEYFDELWVRTSDIRSDEFRNLEGASKQTELNPMLGNHGIRFSLKYPEILKSELLALKKVSEEGKKIGIMIPQVISVEEVTKVREMLKEIDFKGKLGVMIETPAAVQIISNLCEEGIDFISFGTNDLTQYTLAIDRGNEQIQDLYNEMHPAMLAQLAFVIKVCKEHQVETSICGQAASDEKMVEFLVKQGIDSISVNADKAFDISKFVKDMEDAGEMGEKGFKGEDSDVGTEENMKNKGNIEQVDNLEHVKEEIKEKVREVKKEVKEKIKERKEAEENIEVEKKDLRKEPGEKREEFPDVEYGFNVFAEAKTETKEKEGKAIEEQEEEKPEKAKEEKKEKEADEELDIF